MIKTRLTDLLRIRHPIFLGGMSRATSADIVAAVSEAGGLGALGISSMTPDEISAAAERIRARTEAPFGLNALLFLVSPAQLDALYAARPRVVATAWRRPDQDLRAIVDRTHAAGALHIHQADTLDESKRAAEAGADIVVAQGTEAGGHVGVMSTLPLARMVIRAVAPLPVVVAGGIADGAGIAAALMLGAEGVLLGTRFLATNEAPLPDAYKEAICRSDGHDTLLSELPDVIAGQVWPGAFARVLRTPFIQEWLGREGEVRQRRAELLQRIQRAREQGDVANGSLLIGQDAGLIDSVEPAAEIVQRMVREAEDILNRRPAEALSATPARA